MIAGALDVGTNTVLMLVARLDANGSVTPLADLSRITRLGRGVDRSGALDPDAATRTFDAIVEFVEQARKLGATKILTAATATMRDVRDGAAFVERVRERTGVTLEIISGDTEAELSYFAVAHGLPVKPDEKLLIIDIGGGSTEFIRVEPGSPLAKKSLQIGSVRLTERIVRHDPPSSEEAAELRDAVDRAVAELGWASFHPDRMVGIAGTVTTVCAVALKLSTYDHAKVHGHELTRTEVAAALDQFGRLPLADRKRLAGLVEGRADVIFAGTAILLRAMKLFGADRVLVSDQGVRWGLMYRELSRMQRA
jgi:exopolyphosphatase/guanosine-5'-triphosphate,3'-diphosphate pyrophosphatase